jgi:hypothetical protein|tara:strand:- start:353 stop:643 length:291 start_codon:yes stop_codon:yes gene_type:complete
MARDTATSAAKNKRIRVEALREQLSNGGHVQHIIDIAGKLSDGYLDLETSNIAALKAAADIKLKLINKYLPDLKAIEMTGADGSDLIPSAIKIIYE